MRRSFFGKHELPFRQRSAQWPEKAAREQLLHILSKPYLMPAMRKQVFLKCDPANIVAIRRMYPQLPYYNWMKHRGRRFDWDRLATEELWLSLCTPELDADGVRVLQGKSKKQISLLPAEQISTIVRTDRYVKYTQRESGCKQMLLISTQDRAALAQQGLKRLGPAWKQLPNWQDIAATTHCLRLADNWSVKKTDCCPVNYSPEREELLRQLYPHAQWVDCITPNVGTPLRN